MNKKVIEAIRKHNQAKRMLLGDICDSTFVRARNHPSFKAFITADDDLSALLLAALNEQPATPAAPVAQ